MQLILPDGSSFKEKRELVDALDRELQPAEMEMNVNRVSWTVVDAYLAGVRKFRVMDRWSGSVAIGFENASGQLDLRYEEIVRLYLTEMGRYMKMDISPVAAKKGESLDALRKGAIGNAMLGALSAKIPLDKLKRQALIPFLKYGTVGINHYETGDPDLPDRFEIVHGRQLRGLPAFIEGTDSLYGIARSRWVPARWLLNRIKAVHGRTMKLDPWTDMRAQDVPWGTAPPGAASYEAHSFAGGGMAPGASVAMRRSDLLGTQISDPQGYQEDKDRDGRPYVQLEEVYLYDDSQQFVARYIVKAGDTILVDENFEDKRIKVVCPLHIARHTDIGKMFARGFVAPLIPFNDQCEKMLKSLFKNIAEMDMFGTLFVSDSMGIDLKRWKTGPRPKIEKYSPDPMSPDAVPIQLGPKNTGTLPGKVAEIALETMQRLANQGPYYQGETSGRVDSAAGLGFLFNTGNIALGLPTHGLADAFAGAYSRMLQTAKDRMGPGDTILLATVDDAIAGVIIDPTTGQMELSDNPIPDPWEINVNIKDRLPRDSTIRKQELLELYQQQLVDPVRFWVAAYEENMDFPGADKEIWETWRKATWQIIVLFRDGKEPGPLLVGEHTQNPDVQLMAVQQFMNKIEYAMASESVKTVFEQWKLLLETLAGRSFPAGLGAPEELAAQVMQLQQKTGGGQPPGVGGPPAPPPGGIGPGIMAQ